MGLPEKAVEILAQLAVEQAEHELREAERVGRIFDRLATQREGRIPVSFNIGRSTKFD